MNHYDKYTRPEREQIARLLNICANELDVRFGPHPHVPIEQTKAVMADLINATDIADKPRWQQIMAEEIDLTFGKAV